METHKKELGSGFQDDRGTILPIEHELGNVQVIWSKAGAIRANHFHKTDTHACYLVTGSIAYYWRNHGEETIKKEIFEAGTKFTTGPLIDHEMVFLTDSIMIVVSEFKRDPASYDEDIVKISPLHEQYESL